MATQSPTLHVADHAKHNLAGADAPTSLTNFKSAQPTASHPIHLEPLIWFLPIHLGINSRGYTTI